MFSGLFDFLLHLSNLSYNHSFGFFRISVNLYSDDPGAGECMYSHLELKI